MNPGAKLHLLFDCQENINEMLQTAEGKYCGACKRNLTDFRGWSLADIRKYKKQNKQQKICGIFDRHHIYPAIVISPEFKSHKSVFSNSILVLAALSMLTGCSIDTTSPLSEEKKEQAAIIQNKKITPEKDPVCSKDTATESNAHTSPKKQTETFIPFPPPFVGVEDEAGPEPAFEPDTISIRETEQKETVHEFVDKMPEFPGGMEKMTGFIKSELRYPEEARERKLQGKVYVKFIVNENGSISDPILLKYPDKIFEAPTLALIRRMPQWIPGEHRGKKVKVYYILPINFKL